MQRDSALSIEGPLSWRAALLTLAILSVSFGSPLLAVVGLRDMQAAMHTDRSILSLASALVWIGNGMGGIPMGWVADRIGIRSTVLLGALAMAAGLALSSLGSVWALLVGHGLFIGLLGNGAIYAPLIVYASRWFDRRRGTAIALISSGQYIAGMIWPTLLGLGIEHYGWQRTMLGYGVVVLAAILPMLALLRPSPEPMAAATGQTDRSEGKHLLGLPPHPVMGLMCVARFFFCVPMAVPASPRWTVPTISSPFLAVNSL